MKLRGSLLDPRRFTHGSSISNSLLSSKMIAKPKMNNPTNQKVAPNSFICTSFKPEEVNFKNYKDFINRRYKEEFPPSHIRNLLPQQPTDIKGVDQAVYRYVQKKQMYKKIPTLLSNRFFQLKYFPCLHHVSLARKSNISYTFTNKGGFNLNDPGLAKAVSEYKGTYKKLEFFLIKLCPLDTAVGRAKYRKFVKRSLFKSLQRHVKLPEDLKEVAGVFFFRFTIVPATDKEKIQATEEIDQAVKSLLNARLSFKVRLLTVVKEQNKAFKNGELLLNDVRRFNTIGAKNVPGYFPKLPYIDDFNKLI